MIRQLLKMSATRLNRFRNGRLHPRRIHTSQACFQSVARHTECMEDRTLLAAQIVDVSPAAPAVSPQALFDLDLIYSTRDQLQDDVTGLVVRLHYNSSLLTFNSSDNLEADGFQGVDDKVEDIDDGDPATDRLVLLFWARVSGNWLEGTTLPHNLGSLRFQANAPGDTNVQITGQASSGYDFESNGASVTIADQPAGIQVADTGGSTIVTESGDTDQLEVTLAAQPTSDVVIDVSSSDVDEATVEPSTLTFTTANWQTPQEVMVTGVDDNLTDDNQTVDVSFSVSPENSADEYDNVAPQVANAIVISNAEVILSQNSLVVSESGSTDSFTVVLNRPPASDVIFNLASSDIEEATVEPTSITFTAQNWDSPQSVTVTGVDDNIPDDNQTVNIQLSPAAGSDADFAALTPEDVSVTVTAVQNVLALDVDGDGSVQPLTDGILVLRYLAGFSGEILVRGAVGTNATRTSAADVTSWIEPLASSLDIDLDSNTQPLTDGILLIRFMAGFSGDSLVTDAVNPTGSRTDSAMIETYINDLNSTGGNAGGGGAASANSSALPVAAQNNKPAQMAVVGNIAQQSSRGKLFVADEYFADLFNWNLD